MHYRLYYEELSYLRSSAKEFAKRHPDVAEKLDLVQGVSSDPQIEELMQSFAYLSASLRNSLTDQYEGFIHHLVNTLYPHLLAPVPSMSVMEITCISDPKICVPLPKGTPLITRFEEESCRFQTIFATARIPVRIIASRYENNQDLVIIFQSEIPFDEITWDELLVYVEDAPILLRHIFLSTKQAVAQTTLNEVPIDIEHVGFSKDEIAFPIAQHHLYAPQLLQEYFCIPQKFSFFRIKSFFSRLGKETVCNLRIPLFEPSECMGCALFPNTFKLNCVPIINLFEKSSDPIHIDYQQVSYPIIPDGRRSQSICVYRVTSVWMIDSVTKESISIPYYFFPIHHKEADFYWVVHTRFHEPHELALVDLKMTPATLSEKVVYAQTLCYNNINLEKIPLSAPLNFENQSELLGMLLMPFSKRKEPMKEVHLWTIIGYLSMSYEGLCQHKNLKNMLNLYTSKPPALQITSKKIVRRVHQSHVWKGFSEGTRFTMDAETDDFMLCLTLFYYIQKIHPLSHYVELDLKNGALLTSTE